MTLKHIDFYDSPVMRELERQAVKNGTFEVAAIVDIVKTASKGQPVPPKPSKDLYRDMVTLAVALRKKGLEKEATSLENKIFLHKQAETHLYRAIDEDAEDVLNFAHPDGDHHVADAQDHNGDVETLENQHHKIVQIVNKKPTGKYAKIVDNLLLATAEVLDVNLKKIAQVPKGKPKGKLTSEDQEDLAQEQFELESPEDTKKKVGEANAKLKSSLEQFNQSIQAAASATGVSDGAAEWIAFNPLKLMQGQQNVDYYAKKVGLNKTAVQAYWTIHQSVYGQNPMTPDSVSRVIWNTNNYDKLRTLFSKILPEKSGYFDGCKLTDVVTSDKWYNNYLSGDETPQIQKNIASGDTRWKNNPNSVWIGDANWGATGFDSFKLDSASVNTAANDINTTLVAKYNQLFSPDQLAKAAAGVKADLSEFLNSLKFLQESVAEVPTVRKTVGLAVGRLQSILKNIDIAVKQLQTASVAYVALGANDVVPNINVNLEAARSTINELITSLQQLKLDPVLDNPIPPEQLDSIAAKFKKIAITLRNYLANDTEKTQEEIDAVKDNFNSARNIYSLLSASKTTPWAHIRSQIASNFPEATSPTALDKVANDGLELAKQYESAAQKADDGLTAKAEWKTPGKPAAKPGAAKPGVAAKPGAKPAAKPPAGAPAQSPDMKRLDTSKPDRVAVATMQLALNNLGRGISIPDNKAKFPKVTDYKPEDGLTIIGTGPKSNPHINMFDGVWGPSTETAVELANKYLSSVGLTLRTGQRWDYSVKGHKPDTEEAAKFNATAINRANAALGTLSGASSGAGPSSATAVYDKLPPIISNDTVTADEGVGSTIPLTGKDLSSLGSLFNFLEQHNISVKPAVPAERTSDEIGLTFGEWSYLLYWLRSRARYQYDKVADKAIKREYFNTVSTLGMRLTSIGQQLGIKGTSGNQGVVVPTTMLIAGETSGRGQGNQDSRKFNFVEDRHGKGRREGPGSGGNLEGTRTRVAPGSSEDTAPPISDVIDLRREWFNLPYEDMEISPVLRLEDFQRVPGARMAQGLFGGNTLSYQQFLNMLWQQIKSAFASWSREASTDEVTAIQNYYNRWQQGLAKQYRDITQGRRTY